MDKLADLADSVETPLVGRRVHQSTAAGWRNNVLVTLILLSLMVIVRTGVSLRMDRDLSFRYWVFAIPAHFSEVTYGGARYMYFSSLSQHFLTAPDVATLQARLWDAAAGRVPISDPGHYFPGDEKGTVDFVRLAFAVFGLRVESLFYLYCSLLALSLVAFVASFRRDSDALFIGLAAVVALYVAVRTFPLTRELYSVTNPRAIGSLSVIALLHLSLATL